MNREVNISNNKKRLKLYYGLLITVLCVIGVSFAWFRLYLSQSENNALSSRTCFSTTLTEDNSKISLTDAFPVIDSDGLKQDAFTFTLKNNCSGYVKTYITINSIYRLNNDTNYLKDENIKVNISSKNKLDNSSVILSSRKLIDIDNDEQGYLIIETGLNSNEEKSYDLRLWMDGDTTIEQGLNKSWAGKVVVVTTASYQPLGEAILANNTISEPLTVPGKAVSLENEAVLATAEDDYGTSYYFRGNVQNNYVEFANMCWRIVRITGDGSIKLVLYNHNGLINSDSNVNIDNHPCAVDVNKTNGTLSPDESYGSIYNIVATDNAAVGIMYGAVKSNDYSNTHVNLNKSLILNDLETWYENVLFKQNGFSSLKLADTIWCNDKSTLESNTGYASVNTNYAMINRLDNPSFKCPNDNNGGKLTKFTVDDSINGNANLTYPIGLLTADEIIYAGGLFNSKNSSYYLYNNADNWWTMTPYKYSGGVFIFTSSQTKSLDYNSISTSRTDDTHTLRPSVSLNRTVTILGGKGTNENPYIIN